MEKDHADMLQQIVKIQAETLELVKMMANLPGPQIISDGSSKHAPMPAHEEISKDVEDCEPPCGNPKCLHNCNDCVTYYDIRGDSELIRTRKIPEKSLTIIDLIEQFMEYLASEYVYWPSNMHGYSMSREKLKEVIVKFSRDAKPLNEPMGSHEDKLRDFLTYLRKPENWNNIIGTDDEVMQGYWRSFQ